MNIHIHDVSAIEAGAPKPLVGGYARFTRTLTIRTSEGISTLTLFADSPKALALPEAENAPSARLSAPQRTKEPA